jgi:diguanylate cyclase (GGDEF)-like protein
MNTEPIRVLLVDDDEDDFLITQDLLSEIGGERYVLEWKSQYSDALFAIVSGQHDIYLLDYRLGEYSGLDLLRETLARGCRAPMILMTGQGDREVDLEAMRSGAADYLTKGQISASGLERSIRYAIERSKTLGSLRELSTIDELTGLNNRREMSRLVTEAVQRCARGGHPTALIMVDIDHFKSVNDTYGHQMGDQVLRWLAQLLKSKMRTLDYLARYGGEEFAVILKDTSAEEAFLVAERLCASVAAAPFFLNEDDSSSGVIPVRISLGVASIPADAGTEQSLIAAADKALYQAKKMGRNQAVRYEPWPEFERAGVDVASSGSSYQFDRV